MSRLGKENNDRFVFRKQDNVGAAAAEEDDQFLEDCFVDTGDIDALSDCGNPKRIIVGRTGTGKSALLAELLRRHENTISLSPHSLSLNFIANNNVLAFFETAGVNLSAFYILLWKHILVVELLKKKFHIINEETHVDYVRKIRNILYRKDRIKEQAVDYLEKWGNKFWLTTEERVQELTEKIEKNLSGAVKTSLAGVELTAQGARALSIEQKKEVVERGQKVVSEIQIRELENLISVLAENVFDDRREHYYITIDMLDEEWADERIRFKLIRSLIDTLRRFRQIPNVKIILALRHDLLTKIINLDPIPGFQEEKYESLYLKLSWKKKELLNLIECRINRLIKHRYTKDDIAYADIFPRTIDHEESFEYIVKRTFFRPRDLIMFFNECIECATDRPEITAAIVKQAEKQYSDKRLKSLAYEWQSVYPNLQHAVQLFYGMNCGFSISDLTREEIEKRFTDIAANTRTLEYDPITKSLDSLFTGNANFLSVRAYILREFYITGLVGLKSGPTAPTEWSYLSGSIPSTGDFRPNSTIYIHPMFYRALGIRTNC